jgi:hypothetical protein
MAWVEDEPWEMEQGKDAALSFELYSDDEGTQEWPFLGWDVNASVSDPKARTIYPVTTVTSPNDGKITLIFPEDLVNNLSTTKAYRYDALLIAPGNVDADDHFLATGPVTVGVRSSRRDEP